MLTLDKNTLYHVWPDDYEEEEDENGEIIDNSDWAWSDFVTSVDYLLFPFTDFHLSADFFKGCDGFPFRVEGKHMGWMKRNGYKNVLVINSQELFWEILPGGGDCRIKVYSNENHSEIEFTVSHHDGCDHYILKPGSWEDWQ